MITLHRNKMGNLIYRSRDRYDNSGYSKRTPRFFFVGDPAPNVIGTGLTGSSNWTRFPNSDTIVGGCEVGGILTNGTSTVETRSEA